MYINHCIQVLLTVSLLFWNCVFSQFTKAFDATGRVSGSFLFVVSLLSEVTQEDCENQSDTTQKHRPSHRGDECKVHCLR